MQRSPHIRSLLASGDRRTTGRVPEAVDIVLLQAEKLSELLECLFDAEPALRMRAADALEKVSRIQPPILDPYVSLLLDLFANTQQQELQWHLAALLPRLHLSPVQRTQTADVLQRCLDARSSIVKTFALQGLFDLSLQEVSLQPSVLEVLRTAERSGTPAMQARSRKLLRQVEQLHR